MHLHSLSIGDMMTREPASLTAHASVSRGLALLDELEIRHLPVVDRQNRLVGVVSHRDLVAAVRAGEGRRPLSSIMRADVVAVGAETPAHEAAYLRLRHGIGCIPVINASGALVGIATDADFVRVAYVALGGRVPVDQLELEEREAAAV